MARSSVQIILGQGQTGQQPAGTDYISGLQLYGTAPGSFATTACQAVYSVADAEAKGITNNYSDETQAIGIVTISSPGSPLAGDTLSITVTEPKPNGLTTIVSLGTGTAPATPTVTTYAAAVVVAINAGTYSHGYSATNTAGAIFITARKGTGVSLNTGSPIAIAGTGAATYAITQQFGTGSGGATAGVYSKKAIWRYHISEYFRQQPNGKLWVQFTSTPSSTFAEVTTLQNVANGECKQIAVYDPTVTSASAFTSNMTKLNTQAIGLFGVYVPCVIVYAPNVAAITDLSTLANQQAYSNNYVSPIIVQDGNLVGAGLYVTSGISISAVGCVLGTISTAAVSQNIGEIGAFNLTDGTELAVPAFSNGTLVSALSSNLLDQLDAYRYIFATTIANYTGTYFNNDWSAIVQTSDYLRISRNRTINKAARGLYQGVIPLLKSRLLVNADGTLTELTIQQFKGAALPYMNQMVANGDISAVDIIINPNQNVVTTNTITIGVKIVPVGIADFINIQLGFAVKI